MLKGGEREEPFAMAKITRNRFLGSALGALALPLGKSTGAYQTAQAAPFSGMAGGLGSLPFLIRAETRSVCPENPTGEKGNGGMAVPNPADPDLPFSKAASDLGQGWKVRPFVKPKSGETVTIMDVDGPGIIEHIWMATETTWQGNGRACVLRFYWDR